MIFNEVKCHVNTSLGLVGGCIPCTPLVSAPEHNAFFHSLIQQTDLMFCRFVPGLTFCCKERFEAMRPSVIDFTLFS